MSRACRARRASERRRGSGRLSARAGVRSALAELVKQGQAVDFLLLNAGLVPTTKRVVTAAGVEASEAPLIGHHQLTVGLLRADLLSPDARIVITSAEPARGGVPMFKYTDLRDFAAKSYQGNRTAAVEALIRNGPNLKYAPNNAYADAKLIIAWWVAALARRLPSDMAVYAVRCVERHQGGAKRWPAVEVPDDSNSEPHSRHESDAGDRGPSVPPGVGVRNRRLGAILRLGSREVLRPDEGAAPALYDRASQEATWQAVVKVSGVDLSNPAPLRPQDPNKILY